MLDFNSTLRALCGSFLILAACDQQPDDSGDVEFRWETQCVTAGSGSQSFSFGGKGHGPLPWDPDGDPFAPIETAPQEWVRALEEDFRGNAEAVLVGAFERDGGTAECPRNCKIEGLRWDGGGCVGEGSFAYEGLDYAESTYDGSPRFQMTVHGEVELGCSCVE